MLQNRSSSAGSAHANTEASVSGHRLYSDGKSIEVADRKRKLFSSQKENGTSNIFVRREKGKDLRIILTMQEWRGSNVKRKGSKVKWNRRVR